MKLVDLGTSYVLLCLLVSLVATGAAMATELDNEFLLQKRYLNFPVSNGAPLRFISVIIDDQLVRDFGIELAPDKPDYWVFLDVSPFAFSNECVGKNLR